MAEYINVDLTNVDLSFKLPPAGDYLARIENYEVRRNTDNSLKDVAFKFMLLEGPAEGIGLTVTDFQNPNEEMGKKKMRSMAEVCKVAFDASRIDIQPFVGQKLKVKIIQKPGKTEGVVFANIASYHVPDKVA